MRIDLERMRRSARGFADAGVLLESAVNAMHPRASSLERLGAAVAIARFGLPLLPRTARFLKRHPGAAALALTGLLTAWSLARSRRMAASR